VSMGGTSADVMRPATRALLAVTAAGVVLIWPMVRLSQAPDEHPASGSLQDLVVVLIPTQAVSWPQWLGWVGRWPPGVVGGRGWPAGRGGRTSGGGGREAAGAPARRPSGRAPYEPARRLTAGFLLCHAGAVPMEIMTRGEREKLESRLAALKSNRAVITQRI